MTTARRVRTTRNVLLWCAVVLGSAVLIALLGTRAPDDYLDPQGRGKAGIGALVAVLEDHGVRVHVVSTIDDLGRTLSGLPDPEAATVAVGRSEVLSPEGAERVATTVARAQRLVLLDGAPALMHVVDPEVAVLPVGGSPDTLTAGCDDPVTRDGASPERAGVRFVATGHHTTCFPLPSEDGVDHGGLLLVLARSSAHPETYAVGFGPALTNQRVLEGGAAALGLRLLGASPDLVVYTPSITDTVAVSGEPDGSAGLPPWLAPAAVLLALAVITYAVVAGRRLGRLVPEPLPVVVRASETTHSRAELYRSAHDLGRAAATLREGTLARLRPRLRLAATASGPEVVAAAAAHGIPASDTTDLLTGPDPTTDDQLVSLARNLSALEEKVTP